MPPLYELAVISPQRTVYRGKAQSLVAPGAEGYFGVLARHAPMVAALAVGELDVVNERGERKRLAVSGGLLEVTWDGVVVLADGAEPSEEIDVARAQAARQRAAERLRSHAADLDLLRAEAALQRALNRLRVAEKHRGDTGALRPPLQTEEQE